MADEYIRSKFEGFMQEANKLRGMFGLLTSSQVNRYYEWRDRVAVFLNEILGEEIATGFIKEGVEDTETNDDEFAAKKRFLLTLYEKYLIQKNIVVNSKYTPEKRIEERIIPKEPTNREIRVFIVHGHDNETKETVARYVEKLGFRTIILHEQPNKGKTIIEKFESFAEKVDFTIILLTPDDIGAAVSRKNEPKYRARQNVIFEFGFFTAKVGRSKVCALVKGNIEIPSDYSGVIYIPIDESGAWKIALVKEMKNAGLVIDPDRLFA